MRGSDFPVEAQRKAYQRGRQRGREDALAGRPPDPAGLYGYEAGYAEATAGSPSPSAGLIDRACIRLAGLPPTMNLFFRQHWAKSGETTAEYRLNARLEWVTALAGRVMRPPVAVQARVFQSGGKPQDVAACAPAVKAAIDGLVDAGGLPDDSPQYVAKVTFLPPVNVRGGEVCLAVEAASVTR